MVAVFLVVYVEQVGLHPFAGSLVDLVWFPWLSVMELVEEYRQLHQPSHGELDMVLVLQELG